MARILVTTSRMPFALDEIRKFGRQGHDVFATDTFSSAPGSRSRFVRAAVLTPSPRFETDGFVSAVRDFCARRRIDLVLPSFEEVFYLAERAKDLGPNVRVFAPSLSTLALLHDKSRFVAWAADLGLDVPYTVKVTDAEGLRAATSHLSEYFAKPVFSRGGVSLFTNVGPLAGSMRLEECQPTGFAPWIVQEFVHGTDVCSFSVVQGGDVVAHSTYVHPRTIEHAGGIAFESIDSPEALAIARVIARASDYHGQLSLDFMQTPRGLEVIECNPRPTAGVYLMPDRMFVDAVLGPRRQGVEVVPAGRRAKIGVALVRDMLMHWRELPDDVAALVSFGRDVYADPRDLAPALYSLLARGLVRSYRRDLALAEHRRVDLAAAYFHDVRWDGIQPTQPTLQQVSGGP